MEQNVFGYKEKDLTLQYSKEIKKELEKLGLKVKITINGNENIENFGNYNVYDKNGRVNITSQLEKIKRK